jgi:site-specific DNA recombinase
MTQSINNSLENETHPAASARCAIYARYSSDLQRPTSIDDQNRKCAEECQRRGWTLADEWIVADREQSGASLAGRNALNALKEAAKRTPRPFDGIIIDDTSRFGRNLGDVLKLADTFQHYGVFLLFVSPPLDSRDPLFRQVLIFQGMMDERYLGDLRHKVRRGMEGRVLKKFVVGGRCYGYKNVPVEDPSRRGEYGRPAVIGVSLEIVNEEADVIRQIFELYANGNTLSAVSKLLNGRGVAPPNAGKSRRRSGWSSFTIREMLRRNKYRGIHTWGRKYEVRDPETGQKQWRYRPEEEVLSIPVPEWRIVSDELWERVQSQITLRDHFGIKRIGGFNRTEQSKTYLFSGLLKCPCGHNIVIASGQGSRVRYGCPEHRYNGLCKNDLTIRKDRLEEQLIDFLVGRLLRPEMLEYALTRFNEQVRTRIKEIEHLQKGSVETGNLKDEKVRLTKQAENLGEAIAENGSRQSPTLSSLLRKIEAQVEAINARLEGPKEIERKLISKDEARTFVLQKARDLQTLLKGDPLIAKQTLRKHIKQLILAPKQSPAGPVFEVTGDLDLFTDGSGVVQSVSVVGYAQHYTFTLSLSGLQLKPGLSSRIRATARVPVRGRHSSQKSRASAQDQNVSSSAARPRPLEGDQPAAKGSEKHKTGFRKILRELLLEAPRRTKELYPVVLQRQPEDCPPIPCTHRKGVKSKGMEWQHEIRRQLQQIALNRDGFWRLADKNAGYGADVQ